MRIVSLDIENYRIYTKAVSDWGKHINLITGSNGAGKTNLIDAIHYLCMSRSFVTATDIHAVRKGSPGFVLKGEFTGSIRPSTNIQIAYARGDGKTIQVNGVALERISDLIGRVPVVVLSPDDKQLTNDGPEYRRNFIDALISQVNTAYLRNLIDYRRILRQRNKVLLSLRESNSSDRSTLDPWDEQLVVLAVKIVAERAAVLDSFGGYLARSYSLMAGVRHIPSFVYQTFTDAPNDLIAIETSMRKLLNERIDKDIERGTTSVGPHRDEIQFLLDGFELRRYGSQGQHRLFALSLKLAQLYFFSDMLDDLPIFLLDDVFGDLDPAKTTVLMQMLADHPGQVCITAANTSLLQSCIDWTNPENRLFTVTEGTISFDSDTPQHVQSQT